MPTGCYTPRPELWSAEAMGLSLAKSAKQCERDAKKKQHDAWKKQFLDEQKQREQEAKTARRVEKMGAGSSVRPCEVVHERDTKTTAAGRTGFKPSFAIGQTVEVK
jgi:hypothetical protein